MKDEWRILNSDYELEDLLSKKFGISALLAHLLANRVKNIREAEELLFPERIVLGDPFEIDGMKNVVDCLLLIKERGDPMIIYGDYDVDGITGTVLYYLLLKKWGWNVGYYIPSRLEDGYGLSKETIQKFALEGKKKFLTVDCGITSVDEIKYANSIGCEVIVTDHHEQKENLPPAVAIVDPKCSSEGHYFRDFSGVGVAYKVLEAIIEKLQINEDLSNYFDIVSLGTIADIVPLLGENRYFVHKGLQLLSLKNRIGISKLMELSNVNFENIKTHDVGFRIAPKINAVGRIDNANTALQLMIEEDPQIAQKLAEELVKKNQERQVIENEIYQQALAQLDLIEDEDFENQKIFVLVGKNWHPGVIGIVASRILSMYHKPTLMVSIDGEMARGSARSVNGVNIVEVLSQAEEFLQEFGGHKMAAGFSLKTDRIEDFTRRLNEIMKGYDMKLMKSELLIDGIINFDDINENFISDIESLKPFGSGNPEPTFLIEDLAVDQIKPLGKSSFKMVLKSKNRRIEGISFGLLDTINGFRFSRDSKTVDIVANIWKNSWNGNERYELNVIDIDVKPSEKVLSKRVISNNTKVHHSKNGNPTLIVGASSIIEDIVINMALKSKRLIVVLPTNSMLSDLYNSIFAEIKTIVPAVGYVDALHPSWRDESVIFTNMLLLPKVLKDDSDLIICEPQMMIQMKVFEKLIETVLKYKLNDLVLFSSFLNSEEESSIRNVLSNCEVINEFKKQQIGFLDSRNVKNKFEMIKESIENRSKLAILFSDQQSLKSFSMKICKLYPKMCENNEIISYTSNGSNHLIDFLKHGNFKVLMTMAPALPKIQLDRIVYYDFPRNHMEFLKPPYLLRKSSISTVQMLFGTDDVQKNKKDIEEIFPSAEKVLESAKVLKKSFEDPLEVLIHSEIASSRATAKVYLSILLEAGAFNGKNIDRIPTIDDIIMTTREKEGIFERLSLDLLEKDLMNAHVKSIAKIFQNPFDIHEESSY